MGALWFILTACGSIGKPPEPVTIRFTYPNNIRHFYEDYVEAFQDQNPHITVELDPISPNLLSPAETGETDPISPSPQSVWSPVETDVFMATQFDFPTYHTQNAILSLTPFISRDSIFEVKDYYPGTLDLFNFNGETWAWMSFISQQMPHHNLPARPSLVEPTDFETQMGTVIAHAIRSLRSPMRLRSRIKIGVNSWINWGFSSRQ
jgi:hypothetical protein